jgi:hypothetical protein
MVRSAGRNHVVFRRRACAETQTLIQRNGKAEPQFAVAAADAEPRLEDQAEQ